MKEWIQIALVISIMLILLAGLVVICAYFTENDDWGIFGIIPPFIYAIGAIFLFLYLVDLTG